MKLISSARFWIVLDYGSRKGLWWRPILGGTGFRVAQCFYRCDKRQFIITALAAEVFLSLRYTLTGFLRAPTLIPSLIDSRHRIKVSLARHNLHIPKRRRLHQF